MHYNVYLQNHRTKTWQQKIITKIVTTEHEEPKRNDSPPTIDKKNKCHCIDAYQPRRIEEKTQCDGKPSYIILEQGDLERSLLMVKNPTELN